MQLASLPTTTIVQAFIRAGGVEFLYKLQAELEAQTLDPATIVSDPWDVHDDIALMRWADDGGPCCD